MLTIGEDSGSAFTGGSGNDTFNAPIVQDNSANPANTLENFDVLDGGAGNDTLNATLSGANAAPVLRNIENVNVRFASANTLDLANATGVTNVGVENSTAGGTVAGVGTIANLTVKNQNQNVTFTGNTASTLNLTLDTVGKAAALNTVTLATGATGLNLTANNANATIATLASVETLTVAASGSSKIDLTAMDDAVKTATITGTGSVNLVTAASGFTVLTTLTATENTGGVTAIVDASATKVNTGAGKDTITYVEALAATAAVDLGAGNDTFTIAAASTAGAKVNGGEGNDTLKVTNGGWLNADAKNVYTGFEVLEIGGGTTTYNMDNLPGLTAVTIGADLAGAAAITNAAAGTTVTVNASGADLGITKALTYALKDATGKADAVTLTLAGKEQTTADNDADGEITVTGFDADGIETFNIVSNISGFEVEAANGKTNTDYTHTITKLDGDAVQVINISGNANLTVTNLASTTVTKINAASATGQVSVDASNAAQAVEFLGGSANDTYVASAGGDTINAGKGADGITLDGGFVAVDTLIFVVGDSVLNAKANGHDAITNFGTTAGGGALDVIDLGAFGFTGQQSSALANKGALANGVVDGTTLTQADFFLSGGVDRGVAIGTNGGDTYVFIDVDKDGDFNAASDLFIQLVGVTDVSLGNFGF